MKSKNKVTILKDINGNVDIDIYFEEQDIPQLESFLKQSGAKEVVVKEDETSKERNMPFRDYKPSVKKRISHDVDWTNPDVIKEIIFNSADDKLVLEKEKKTCQMFRLWKNMVHKMAS